MKFLRNPEITKSLFFYAVVTLVATSIAFTQSLSVGVLVFVVCLVFTGAYLFSTYKRYGQIEKLSSQIDDILVFLCYNSLECNLDTVREAILCLLILSY